MAKRKRKTIVAEAKIVKTEEKKFPHFFRNITAPFVHTHQAISRFGQIQADMVFWRLIIPLGLVVILLLNIQIFISQTYTRYQEAQNQQQKVLGIKTEISHWEELLQSLPNYRDGNIQLALLYYQVGNFTKAREYAQKAYQLDPNYPFNEKLTTLINN